MKIGIIRESKIPRDTRTPLNPIQCSVLKFKYPLLEIVIQPCTYRSYSDEEYMNEKITLQEDLSDCDYIFGIKEVAFDQLITGKKYFFFSHTIKKQKHNQKLLKKLLEKNITMIDYETICDEKGNRLIAFGKWAGIVGAHNAIWAYGKRTKKFDLPRLYQLRVYSEVFPFYDTLKIPPVKIVLTGTGRVANGAVKVLEKLKIRRVAPNEFLKEEFEEAVYVQLGSKEMYAANDGSGYNAELYHADPTQYHSIFEPYTLIADIMINGIFWNDKIPKFFTAEAMLSPSFSIKTIADITCDIAPDASIPSTIYSTTISEPLYGYNPFTLEEEAPFQKNVIDVMSIDNLPNELPRDASEEFGDLLILHVIPEMFKSNSSILDNATICKNGALTEQYNYLDDFAKG